MGWWERSAVSSSLSQVVQAHVDGKSMASVLYGLLVIVFPVCIVSPILFIAFSKIRIPASVSSFVSKRVVNSSTYISTCVRR